LQEGEIMAERDKEYIGSPLSDQNYQDKDRRDEVNSGADNSQKSGLGGEQEPNQQEVAGDPRVKQKSGGHGDKEDRRGGPTL
jgi:hypothetical protein